jgi:hypothetical protein
MDLIIHLVRIFNLDIFEVTIFSSLYNVDIEEFSLSSLPIGVVLRFC